MVIVQGNFEVKKLIVNEKEIDWFWVEVSIHGYYNFVKMMDVHTLLGIPISPSSALHQFDPKHVVHWNGFVWIDLDCMYKLIDIFKKVEK